MNLPSPAERHCPSRAEERRQKLATARAKKDGKQPMPAPGGSTRSLVHDLKQTSRGLSYRPPSAEEVEEAVLRHGSVRDCIVVGRPSEVWGSEVTAVISMSSSGIPVPTAHELAASMRHLARYKHPKAVIVVDHIRRSPAGKADYGWARRVASSNS